MRLVRAIVFLEMSATPALAQREPQFVVPGRPDVPVIINGVDASWGVVEGEFGLDRPGLVAPTVIYRPYMLYYPTVVAPWYPADGKKPGYGRLEVIPPANRRLPPPAPSYFRSWSSGSAPGPVTEYAPYYGPQALDLGFYGGGRRHGPNHRPGGGPGPVVPPAPPHKEP